MENILFRHKGNAVFLLRQLLHHLHHQDLLTVSFFYTYLCRFHFKWKTIVSTQVSPSQMPSNGTRKHIWCLAMAPAVRSESTLNSMVEMLIFLPMRESTQLQAAVVINALHVLCARQPLEMGMKKHVQAWLHRMETGTFLI